MSLTKMTQEEREELVKMMSEIIHVIGAIDDGLVSEWSW